MYEQNKLLRLGYSEPKHKVARNQDFFVENFTRAPKHKTKDTDHCGEMMHQSAAVKLNTKELDKVYTPIYINPTTNNSNAVYVCSGR
jgi:hypothetical protein